jgi:hypothetical protein
VQLIAVQRVGLSGVPSQVGDGRELGRCHRVGLEGKAIVLVMAPSDDLETMAWSRTAAHGEVT